MHAFSLSLYPSLHLSISPGSSIMPSTAQINNPTPSPLHPCLYIVIFPLTLCFMSSGTCQLCNKPATHALQQQTPTHNHTLPCWAKDCTVFLFHYTLIKKWKKMSGSIRPQKAIDSPVFLTHCSPFSAYDWIGSKQDWWSFNLSDSSWNHFKFSPLLLHVSVLICVWMEAYTPDAHMVWHNGILHCV